VSQDEIRRLHAHIEERLEALASMLGEEMGLMEKRLRPKSQPASSTRSNPVMRFRLQKDARLRR
jgi:hypothetical protein